MREIDPRDCQHGQADTEQTVIDKLRAEVSRLTAELAEAKDQLETERLRLAGCGVAALGYFYGCKDEYRSASLDDVLRLRANCDQYRNELAELRSQEPVAYHVFDSNGDGKCVLKKYLADPSRLIAVTVVPLYARPVPAAPTYKGEQ